MKKQTCSYIHIGFVLLLGLFAVRRGADAVAASCTNVKTRFVGIPATNCVLPPLSLQLTNPICEVVADGFPNGHYLTVTLSNVPPGYSVTNGVYADWCVDYSGTIEPGVIYKPLMYLSTGPLPPTIAHTNWNKVNYILNHKEGGPIDIQAAIWHFIGGPVPSSDPVFHPPSAIALNLIAEARAYGGDYIPGPGEVTAVIFDIGPMIQLNIIEVVCPGILEVCQGGRVTLCTTNIGTGPLSYSWAKDGVTIPGETGACFSRSNFTTADSGVYAIRVSNECSAATNWVTVVSTNTADTVPPVITCASNRIYSCLADVPPAPDDGVVSAMDNGGIVSVVMVSETITTNGCDIELVRRYRASDPCGNVSFCDHTDHVRDTVAPVLIGVPSNATYQCLADVPLIPIVTATDNCDPDLQLSAISSISAGCPMFIETRWTVTDRCGNSSSASQVVRIFDTIAPLVACPPELTVANIAAIPLPPSSLAQFLAQGGSASDNCDALLEYRVIDEPLVGGACGGFVRRTHVVIDDCTNAASCVQVIQVAPPPLPTITCPPGFAVQCPGDVPACATNLAQFLAQGGRVTGSSVISYTCADGPLMGGACGGTLLRTHTVMDSCTNVASCTQIITVRDTIPPRLTCAPDRIVECGGEWWFMPPAALDNCDGTNVTIAIVHTMTNAASPRCPNLFTVKRTWKATDACGNEAFCTQAITVVDTTPPNLTCPGDRIVECGDLWMFTPPTAADTCDGIIESIEVVSTMTNAANPRCPGLFSVKQTWRAADSCGNASFCSQTINVVDTTPPAIACAADRIVECGFPWDFTPPTAVDLCDNAGVRIEIINTVTNAGVCPTLFIATRTWRVSDSCGNSATCAQSILVADTRPPALSCAADRIVECGLPWSFTPPTATDLCDSAVTITIVNSVTNAFDPSCPGSFIAQRTWKATDDCGNSATCSQSILVMDTMPPVLTCPGDRFVECGSPWAFGNPTARDICDGPITPIEISTVTNQNPICSKSFTAVRTWRATDACGNASTCRQTITLVDTQPPVLTCARDRIVECGQPWEFTRPAANDVCEGTNVVIEVVSTMTNTVGFCGKTFSATRVWRALDSCTNTASCSQTITVVDTQPPVLNCAPNRMVECGSQWDFTPPAANDVCDGTGIRIEVVNTVTNNLGFCGRTFSATRTWRALDSCTNPATCSQTITVIDTLPPLLSGVPANATYECIGSVPPPAPVTATDQCDPNVTLTLTSITNGACPTMIVRSWKATDACGNMVSASQIITVIERPLVLTQPPADTVVCAGSNATFCVTANSTCPLTYKWYRAGNLLAGETNQCLTIANAQAMDAGRYCVMVSSPCYSLMACANLTLRTNISVGPVPVPECIFVGTNLVICPPIFGPEPYTCVWRKDGVVLPAQPKLFLTLPGYIESDAGHYSLEVIGPCNRASREFDLPAPSLVCQPNPCLALTNCVGSSFQICETNFAMIPGVLYSYQWFKVVGGVTNTMAEETNQCLTRASVTSADAGFYFVRVNAEVQDQNASTNFCGAELVVPTNLAPRPLNNLVFCSGGESAQFCADTGDATGPFQYQWYRNGLPLPNETNPCHLIANVSAATIGEYCVVVRGLCNSVTNCGLLTLQGALGDFVWEDRNRNGCQDPGEPGMSNVTVQLLDCANSSVLRSTTTDANGLYLFTCVEAGSYRVRFVPAPGCLVTLRDNCDDTQDSDPDPVSGITACVNVPPGQTNRTVDAGIYKLAAIGDYVWLDSNANGLQDAGEPGEHGIPGVTVKLLDCANNVLAITNTDANGLYLFTGLTPGNYRVMFNKPANYFFTTPNQLPDDRDSDANPADGMTACYPLLSGETNRTVDAGLFLRDPRVCVTKEIACLLPGDNCGPFGEIATGYWNSTNYPAFCYAITVTNCGAADLTNMTVIDDKLGDVTVNFFASPSTVFPVGGSVTRFFKMAWTVDTTNTVLTTGRSVFDGRLVNASDSAIALIEPASIVCQSYVTSPADTDGNSADNHVLLPQDGQAHPVTFTTVLCNNGAANFAALHIDAPALSALGCNLNAPAALAAGACYTNVCTVNMTCAQAPVMASIHVSAKVDTRVGHCGYDLRGSNITAHSTCEVRVECPPPDPCLQVVKTADRLQVRPFDQVTYSYFVTNCGGLTLTNVLVKDDHATPDIAGDDVLVGTIAVFPPGATTNFTKALYPPVVICATNTMVPSGLILIETLANGNIKATFVQAFDVNDNTYGVNSYGWVSRTHTFGNLTGSDHCEWQFKNGAGQAVLVFDQDYISATTISSNAPSGYACLGLGGDGGAISGNTAFLLSFDTSLAQNLNKQPFLGNLPQYIVNSPASNDVNAAQWEFRMMYTVVIDKAAFGPSGFGSASIIDQHNSPGKRSVVNPTPCPNCSTNVVVATGRAGTRVVSDDDYAIVCLNTNLPLGALGDYVWHDLNTNGVQDAGEPGVPNVSVKLLGCSGNPLATTSTGPNGRYLFTGLPAGSYKVQFTLPVGYQFTRRDQGGDATDSDADSGTGMTGCYNLGAGQTNLTVDAGLVLPPPPCHPALVVTADCQDAAATGGTITFNGTLHNTGDTTITNLSVTHSVAGLVRLISSLAPGDTTTFSGNYTPAGCGSLTSSINVTGRDMCAGASVTGSDSLTCSVPCPPAPCVTLVKTAGQQQLQPFKPITYSYFVTNCGSITLTNVVVSDDHGTPDIPGDDVLVGTVSVLPPGATTNFTKALYPPVVICSTNSTTPSGLILIETVADGNIKATFVQAFDVNDNTYGVNSYGWVSRTHTFGNLTGSDHCEWQFKNGAGQVVLVFDQDYISATTISGNAPSGYACLGLGGDGGAISGNTAYLLSFDTSLAQHLNQQPFLGNLAQYTVNSPASNDVNAAQWEFRMMYSVVIDKAAFGPSGFGSASIIDQHNSPGKRSVVDPTPCPTCVTNVARIVAGGGVTPVTNYASAVVCTNRSCLDLASLVCATIANSPDDRDGLPADDHVSLPADGHPHNVSYSVTITAGAADLSAVTLSDPVLSGPPFNCVMPAPFALAANASVTIPLCTVPVTFSAGSTPSTCANPRLNAAAGCTVLQLGGGHVKLTGPAGGIDGNICIGPNGKLSIAGEEYVTGTIRLAAGADYAKSGSGSVGAVINGVDLTAEINAAMAASATAAALPCSRTLGNLTTTQSIQGNGGLNVLCIQNLALNGATVTLNGTASDTFILNITGKMKLDGGSKIVAAGGVLPGNILFNLIGNGSEVSFTGGGGGVGCCNSSVDGTLLAIGRKVALNPGLVNGAVISGENIYIVSGSSVRCAPPTDACVPVINQLTVTAQVNTNTAPNVCALAVGSQCSATIDCGGPQPGPFTPQGGKGGVVEADPVSAETLVGARSIDLTYGYAVVAGSATQGPFVPSSEGDWYSFDAPAGTRIWALVDNGGAQNSSASWDSRLTLLAADGVTVLAEDDDDGSGNGGDSTLDPRGDLASAMAGRTLTAGGHYYLRVKAQTAGGTITPYHLFVALAATGANESEANNKVSQATPVLTAGAALGRREGTISPAGDADYYSVVAPSDATLYVSADCDPRHDGTATDLILELLGTDGASVLFSADSSAAGPNASEAFCYRVTNAGTYYVKVRHFSPTGTGSYSLMVARDLSELNVTALQVIGADVQVSFLSGQGKTYRVERSDRLSAAATWTLLPGTVSGTGGTARYLDVNGANGSQRFYRVKQVP